ncbi:MAG: PQQ-binding-like beta-propeller repeat protein, partial [Deltaproteobacteria bacterium]|nr:PQQ-binding-like beta-propeller repeat protein [Deltaproteobacteria bacterium]
MKIKIKLWVLFLLTGLFCINTPSDSFAKKRSGEAKEEIERNLLWTKEFSGMLRHVELLSNNGLLHVVAQVGKKKPSGVKKENWPRQRYILNQEGEILWESNYNTTALLADQPYVTMLQAGDNGIDLIGINSSGGTSWRWHSDYGTPVSTLADPSSSTLYMVVMPYLWAIETDKPADAKVVALSLATGTPKWQTEIKNISGKLTDFDGGELESDGGILWWAGGGRAAAIQIAGGNLLWQKELDKNFKKPRSWVFKDDKAFVADEKNLWVFSKQSGPQWNKEYGKKREFYSMATISGGLLLATGDKSKYYLQALRDNSGEELWASQYKAKPNKFGLPQGIAISGNKAVFAVEGKIVGISPSTGKEIYSQKIKKKVFNSWSRIIPRDNHFVMTGPEGINAYRYSDGTELWSHEDFVDPVAEIRKGREAILQYAFQQLHSSTAPDAKKAWDKHREGSISYSEASSTASLAQSIHNQKVAAQARESAAGLS